MSVVSIIGIIILILHIVFFYWMAVAHRIIHVLLEHFIASFRSELIKPYKLKVAINFFMNRKCSLKIIMQ